MASGHELYNYRASSSSSDRTEVVDCAQGFHSPLLGPTPASKHEFVRMQHYLTHTMADINVDDPDRPPTAMNTMSYQFIGPLLDIESSHIASIRPGYGVLSLKTPHAYDGRRSGTTCQDWIADIKEYIEFYSIGGDFKGEAERIQIAASYLIGCAKCIWNVRKRMHKTSSGSIAPIILSEEYLSIIKVTCTDFNLADRTCLQYNKLKQVKAVSYFVYNLLDIADQLPQRLPDYEIRERLKSGLREHVLNELDKILDQSEDLIPFIELCDRIEANSFFINDRPYLERLHQTHTQEMSTRPTQSQSNMPHASGSGQRVFAIGKNIGRMEKDS